MSKKVSKKAAVTTKSIILNDQEIDASIDMKLSKQDLIDMVVEETREDLEERVEAASKLLEEAETAVKKIQIESEALIRAKIQETYKEEITFISKYGKVNLQRQLDNCDLVIVNGAFMSYEEYNQLRYSDRNTFNTLNAFYCKGSLAVQNVRDANSKKSNVSVAFDLFLSLNETEIKKIYTPLVKAVKELNTAQTLLNNERKQLQSVDKMGKKAKAQLIKRLLDSSEGGKSLLSNMSGIKTNISQFLLATAQK